MDASDRSLLNIVNYPKFQFPNLVVLLSGILVTGLILGSFIVLQARLLFVLAEGSTEVKLIESILWKYGLICGGTLALAALLLVFWSLIITHRIVGPIPRVKDEIESMKSDEEVHLFYVREYDYMEEFFEKVNSLLIRLLREHNEYELTDSEESEDPDPSPN